jgi:hypothetical protein
MIFNLEYDLLRSHPKKAGKTIIIIKFKFNKKLEILLLFLNKINKKIRYIIIHITMVKRGPTYF